MGVSSIHAVLQVRDPVQVVPNKHLNLLLAREVIKERKEFQLEDQMIRSTLEFFRDLQGQLMKHFPHVKGGISHEKALISGKS